MELTKDQHKEIIDHFNEKEGWRDYHKMILTMDIISNNIKKNYLHVVPLMTIL